jgi:hypothetical protein
VCSGFALVAYIWDPDNTFFSFQHLAFFFCHCIIHNNYWRKFMNYGNTNCY